MSTDTANPIRRILYATDFYLRRALRLSMPSDLPPARLLACSSYMLGLDGERPIRLVKRTMKRFKRSLRFNPAYQALMSSTSSMEDLPVKSFAGSHRKEIVASS